MSEVPLYAHALHAASGGVISPFLCLTGWKESGSVQIVELTESVLGLTELCGLNVAGVVSKSNHHGPEILELERESSLLTTNWSGSTSSP